MKSIGRLAERSVRNCGEIMPNLFNWRRPRTILKAEGFCQSLPKHARPAARYEHGPRHNTQERSEFTALHIYTHILRMT